MPRPIASETAFVAYWDEQVFRRPLVWLLLTGSSAVAGV